MRKALIAVLFVTVNGALSACVGRLSPSADVMRAADYGPYPSDYKTIIDKYHEARFKDPASVQVQYLSTPQKAWGGLSFYPYFGYVVCLTVTARNSLGGLTESHLTGVFIRDGQVVQYRSANPSIEGTDVGVRDMCKNVLGKFDTPAGSN
ncbi:hypothetical protein [Paraburkholderia sp. BL10I2N1]|uniref:hypothetical protein n=1 Tax=Paraburkholderia sp. BL10I2N1 TaxID=1938796 RepID=UPI00105E19AC|nr:hypothetical protein [Paraburkholderia sp. BL10I2N1]TDN62604.1 hypothetical protein B0G77_6188 [Paraburkholderia sp. BL10I2N1]